MRGANREHFVLGELGLANDPSLAAPAAARPVHKVLE
jgi:hypothetical protein